MDGDTYARDLSRGRRSDFGDLWTQINRNKQHPTSIVHKYVHSTFFSMPSNDTNPIEERLRQREATQHPLRLKSEAANLRGSLPNTPLAVVTVAFLLGGLCSVSFLTFAAGGLKIYWWSTYQLGFFLTVWSFFHWAEFAVTAGWNLEKCNIDCACSLCDSSYHKSHIVMLCSFLT